MQSTLFLLAFKAPQECVALKTVWCLPFLLPVSLLLSCHFLLLLGCLTIFSDCWKERMVTLASTTSCWWQSTESDTLFFNKKVFIACIQGAQLYVWCCLPQRNRPRIPRANRNCKAVGQHSTLKLEIVRLYYED